MSQANLFPIGRREEQQERYGNWRQLHTTVGYWPANDRSNCVTALVVFCQRSWTGKTSSCGNCFCLADAQHSVGTSSLLIQALIWQSVYFVPILGP